MLTFPAAGLDRNGQGRSDIPPLSVAEVDVVLHRGREDILRLATDGDPFHAATLSLQASPKVRNNADVFSAAVYASAIELVETGRMDDAISAFSTLLPLPQWRQAGLIALAVCAMRQKRHEAALALAVESLKLGVKHPRACCIAGLCELERGDRRAAQGYLAAAARLARAHPDYRDDLRTAQRTLLLMHLT